MDLVESLLSGNARAAARLISMLENRQATAGHYLAQVYKNTGNAYILGITGPPGAGKSSLVYDLAVKYREAGKRIGIIAVDPTSPFTGGALLGDRVRMQELTKDSDIFIRSMASRGALGGLALAAGDAIHILDAMGKDIIIVETVGSGQSEVDIIKLSHSVIVMTMPGGGDQIQAMKAGILEIADILVVNKADKEGADKAVVDLESMLHLNPHFEEQPWKVPVVKTSTFTKEGIGELFDTIEHHAAYLKESGKYEEKQAIRRREGFLEKIIFDIEDSIRSWFSHDEEMQDLMEKVLNCELDPQTATEDVLRRFLPMQEEE